MTTDQNRAYYLDVLRIIATLAVIMLHVSAQNWDTVDVHSFAWHVFNFFDSLVRWAVPVFIMISGAVFLDNDRPLSIQKLYRKNILRATPAALSFLRARRYTLYSTAKEAFPCSPSARQLTPA